MGKIVSKILLVYVFLLLFPGCAPLKNDSDFPEQDLYAILEKENYKTNGLFYKTLSFEQLGIPKSFTYQTINENNYQVNNIFEEQRYIDFDTIFSPEKRQKIEEHFKALSELKLKKSKMRNPEILSKTTRSVRGEPSKSIGINRVTFPFIVEGNKGELYGFIFRYPQGSLFMYNKTGAGWEQLAIVPLVIYD